MPHIFINKFNIFQMYSFKMLTKPGSFYWPAQTSEYLPSIHFTLCFVHPNPRVPTLLSCDFSTSHLSAEIVVSVHKMWIPSNP